MLKQQKSNLNYIIIFLMYSNLTKFYFTFKNMLVSSFKSCKHAKGKTLQNRKADLYKQVRDKVQNAAKKIVTRKIVLTMLYK